MRKPDVQQQMPFSHHLERNIHKFSEAIDQHVQLRVSTYKTLTTCRSLLLVKYTGVLQHNTAAVSYRVNCVQHSTNYCGALLRPIRWRWQRLKNNFLYFPSVEYRYLRQRLHKELLLLFQCIVNGFQPSMFFCKQNQ